MSFQTNGKRAEHKINKMKLKDYRGLVFDDVKIVMPGSKEAIPYWDAPEWCVELDVIWTEHNTIYLGEHKLKIYN